jgi:hypothetical protein
MWKPRWLLALPVALAALVGTASASSVRDQAGMFSPEAVRQAELDLNRIERENQIPTTIETIDSLNGEDIADLTLAHAKRSATSGIYIVIAKRENKIYDEVARSFSQSINAPRQRAIRQAFGAGFKKGDFDAGLLQGVKAIGAEAASAKAQFGSLRQGGPVPQRRVGPVGRVGNPRGSFGLGSLLGIVLLIVGVLFVIRLLGRLFGGGYAAGAPGRMGAGAGAFGGGPGGYGGGGGGFWSSVMGGLGGAMAGNWLYDQFSGRHHGGSTDSASSGGDAGTTPETPADDWSGGTGGGDDWGGGGGGDVGGGGGDWGGGGGGGGGDW